METLADSIAKSQPDSPTGPRRPDATPIFGSSLPPPGSHAPSHIKPVETVAQVPVEAANEKANNPSTVASADRSIIDLLKECIPQGSKSVLERMVHYRAPYARVSFKSDAVTTVAWDLTPTSVWKWVDRLKPSEHGVLVIDDIDDSWCKEFTRYPEAINETFVLEHILGCELDVQDPYHGPADIGLQQSITADCERLARTFPGLSHPAVQGFCRHIDCWLELKDSELDVRSVHGWLLRPAQSGWLNVNSFLSYCQLKENLRKFIHSKSIISISWP